MSYFHICPYCGANLDPGERCDCPGALQATSAVPKLVPAAPKTFSSCYVFRERVRSKSPVPDGSGGGVKYRSLGVVS